MSESVSIWIALFAAIPPTLMALATLIASLKNSRQIEEVRRTTNGRLDQLLNETAKSNMEQGTRQGRAEAKSERLLADQALADQANRKTTP